MFVVSQPVDSSWPNLHKHDNTRMGKHSFYLFIYWSGFSRRFPRYYFFSRISTLLWLLSQKKNKPRRITVLQHCVIFFTMVWVILKLESGNYTLNWVSLWGARFFVCVIFFNVGKKSTPSAPKKVHLKINLDTYRINFFLWIEYVLLCRTKGMNMFTMNISEHVRPFLEHKFYSADVSVGFYLLVWIISVTNITPSI